LIVLTSSSQYHPLSVGAIWAEIAGAGQTPSTSSTSSTSSGLSDEHRRLLRAAADEIIPAGDGMPEATASGAVDYIEALLGKVPDLQTRARAALARLAALSGAAHRQPFERLSAAQRVNLLRSFERESARTTAADSLYSASDNLFALLRDLVYEGYYTSPRVWPLLGYEFHPTSRKGPVMPPFDESILDAARRRPRSYREVKS
jgi:hypothetical protein